MNIVIVCDFGTVNGGAAKVAIASARGLAAAGAAVTYVCAISPVGDELRHPNVTTHCLGFDSVWQRSNPVAAALDGIWNIGARNRLEAILAGLPRSETIVHFHQWTKALSPSVLLAPLRYGLPAIASLHDYFLVCPNGAYYHFPAGTPCRVAPLSAACVVARCDRHGYAHKAVRVLRQGATRAALARAGRSLSALSVSPFADRVAAGFIGPEHARYIVRSPVEARREAPVRVAQNRDFVYVGRLVEEKGVALLAAVAHSAGLPLTMIGDGPLLEALRGMGPIVRCTGWLDAASVIERTRRARALVFPSTWYETGGLVVIDALAQGIPVIVSRKTAPADLVVDGENGFLIDPDDRDALLACMRTLLDDDVAARMGAAAYRRYWSDPQTLERHSQALLAVYRSVLDNHARWSLSHENRAA